ncbi:hypothetical protein U8335_13185 [Roseiconus lacunae]|uniref:hypothetical protein n=1 Tax=Roseiconus lacunae TaxID=2605694 RepID=UPI00309327E8|nr:hypothetical protein U8335_13185 [Stieleria sp. HD01]
MLRLVLMVVSCAASIQCRGEVVFTLSEATVPIGGTGQLDVWVSTSGTTETFASLEFELLTSPDPYANLWFQSSQSESFATSPDYIFAGDSEAIAADEAITDPSGQIRLEFADSTLSNLDVTLSPGESKRMASLGIQHNGDSAETFFVSFSGWVRQADGTPLQYSSNFGRVDAITAIPEPALLSVIAFASVPLLLQRRRVNANQSHL